MSKTIIGTLVGGLILFIWQFLSWGVLNLHADEMMYTEHQEEILTLLNEKLDEGTYMLPMSPPGASQEVQQQTMENNIGKPWASIAYHKSMSNNMGMNMIRSLIINCLAVFLLCWLLGKIPELDMKTSILSTLAVGMIGYFINTYINSIWFETSTIVTLMDTIVSWGIVGSWLGFWLNRN